MSSAAVAAPNVGDYRSDLLTGNWSNTLTWLRYNGVIWLTNLTYPGQNSGTGNVEITSGKTVSMDITPAYAIGSLTITSGTLNFNSTTGRTLSVSGNTIFSGTGTMNVANASGTNVHTLNLGGTVTLADGATMDLVSSGDDVVNVVFNCTANQEINVNGSAAYARFYDLTINNNSSSVSIQSNTHPFIVRHNLAVIKGNLILAASANVAYTVENNLSVASGNTLTHTVTYANDNKLLYVAGDLSILGTYTYTGFSPVICMNGSGTRYIGTAGNTLCKLFLLNGEFRANGNLTVDKDFYAMWNNATGSFHTNGQTIQANWGLVNSGGTVYVDGGSLTVGNTIAGLLSGNTGSSNGNIVVSSGTLTTPAIYLGRSAAPATTAAFTQSGGTVNTSLINIGMGATYTYSAGTGNLNGNLNLAFSTSTFNNNATDATTIGGDLINNGTYNSGTGTIIEIMGNWVNNGTYNASAASKVIFRGTDNQTIGGVNPSVFNHLILNPASGKKITAAANISIKDKLELLSGTFDQAGFTANRQTAGGTFSMAANTIHTIAGSSGGACSMNNFPANFTTISFDPTSTTEYAGTSDQQICSAPVYGHLILKNAGVKIAGAGTTEIKGNFINTGGSSLNANSGTIRLSGNDQAFAGLAYSKLELTNGGTKSLSANASVKQLLQLNDAVTLALGNNDITLLSDNTMTAAVGEIPMAASITYGTGKFIVERFMPAKKAWRFVSAPVKPGSKIFDTWQEGGSIVSGKGVQITGPGAVPAINGLDAATAGYSMKYYNPAVSGGFTMVTDTKSSNLANDKGYMIFVRGDRSATVASGINNTTVLRTKGELVIGTKTYAVPANGLASVGNPFASRIDLTKVFNNGGIGGASNVNASVTVWDPQVGAGTNKVGTYRTYTRNASGDFESTPLGTVKNYIESGQAFYVQSIEGGTFTLNEQSKEAGSANASRIETVTLHRIRTNLWGPDPDTALALIDGTLTDVDPSYSNAIDNMDVRKMANSEENFGILSSGQLLIVERKQPFVITDTIFYKMTGMKQQTYQLQFLPLNLDEGINAFLEDAYLNTSTPVSLLNPTIVHFTVTSVAASFASNRFRLVFKQLAPLPVTIVSVAANRNNDRSIAITWKVENELNIVKYTVERSADGIRFNSIAGVVPSNNNVYTKTDINPLSGDNYYRIKAESLGGTVQYSAIVKVAPLKQVTTTGVYPNPVTGKKVHLQFSNQQGGSYNVTISNKLGQVLYSGTVNVTGAFFIKTIELSNNTPAGVYQLCVSGEEGKITTQQFVVN